MHICYIKNPRLGHDLPRSDFATILFSRNFAFTFTKFCENKTLLKVSKVTVTKHGKANAPA